MRKTETRATGVPTVHPQLAVHIFHNQLADGKAGLVPNFLTEGWIDGNAIAVFTAIGMCWSGYLSTHTAMLDSLGYRELTSKAILSHTVGGLVAGVTAHWLYILVSLF